MRILLGLLFITLSIGVMSSDVYKCDNNGEISFSQQPCGDHAIKIVSAVTYNNVNSNVDQSNDMGSALLFRPVFASMDDDFKEYFTSNFKNKHHTTSWAKHVIGFELDEFTRYIIVHDKAGLSNLLILCSQIRSYNINHTNNDGKVISGEVRLRSSHTPIAKYSPFFDSCSTIDGKESVY